MLLADAQSLRPLFICPRCRGPLVDRDDRLACGDPACALSRMPFLRVGGQHVLIDHERSVLSRERFEALRGESEKPRGRVAPATGLRRRMRDMLDGKNAVAHECADAMSGLLASQPGRPRLLVVGGGRLSDGPERLFDDPKIDVVGFDIYPSPLTHFVADAHDIPLLTGSVDAVWIQAVLEHVLEPHRVAAEIARVVRLGGLVFSDTPFLQQVHEGPYDFTRFTESGHRWLFRDFERIRSGSSAGVGTQCLWTLEYTLRALTRSPALARAARRSMFWWRALDAWISEGHHVDGASGVYFFGRRVARPLTPNEVLDHYRGAQRVTR
jgi:SAM-dependent methyltransferase